MQSYACFNANIMLFHRHVVSLNLRAEVLKATCAAASDELIFTPIGTAFVSWNLTERDRRTLTGKEAKPWILQTRQILAFAFVTKEDQFERHILMVLAASSAKG